MALPLRLPDGGSRPEALHRNRPGYPHPALALVGLVLEQLAVGVRRSQRRPPAGPCPRGCRRCWQSTSAPRAAGACRRTACGRRRVPSARGNAGEEELAGSEHGLAMPCEVRRIRLLVISIGYSQRAALHLVVVAAVVVLDTQGIAHHEAQVSPERDISEVEQSMQIAPQRKTIAYVVGTPIEYGLMCAASRTGRECSPVTAHARS